MTRHFLPAAALTVVLLYAGCSATSPAARYATLGSVTRNDRGLDDLIAPGAEIEQVAGGFEWTEGPVWIPEGGYLLFSDIPANTIYQWKEGEGLSVYMRPAGFNGAEPFGFEMGTNGLLVGPDGALVAADHGNRAIVQIRNGDFTRQVLAGSYQGKRLNSPNDAVFNSKGDLYFTDPPYGLTDLNDSPDKEVEHNGVYLLTAGGRLELLTDEMTFPNGIALSPDEQTLYVAQSDGSNPIIRAFDVKADGTVENGRIFFDAAPLARQGKIGAPDGMKVDAQGNLFATGPGGVLVISPDGRHLGTIETGQATANVGFGGPDFSMLYMTADSLLLRIPTKTRGLKLLDTAPFPGPSALPAN